MRHSVWIVALLVSCFLPSAAEATDPDRPCKYIDVTSGKVVNRCLQTAVYASQAVRTRSAAALTNADSWTSISQREARLWDEPAPDNGSSLCGRPSPCNDPEHGCAGASMHQQLAYLRSWMQSMWCR